MYCNELIVSHNTKPVVIARKVSEHRGATPLTSTILLQSGATVARNAHNVEVVGSIPTSAPNLPL